MKTTILVCSLSLFVFILSPACASDRAAADSLAMSGTTLSAKGNTAQAKEMFYKALANDETCPDAIFELAKIFDKENNTAAASDFYQRASLLMAQENKPTTVAKRAEADKRVKALNPFAPRVSGLFEDYAQDLDRLTKKVPDSVTQEAAFARVGELKMASVLAPDKMPKFYANLQAQKVAAAAAAEAEAKSPPSRNGFSSSMTPPKPVNNIPPEVERELKAAYWGTVTGTWVKKSAGVYDVTDGKLEAAKTNGAVDLWVQKGAGGTVKVMVRNDFNSNDTFYSESTGYGFSYTKKDCRVYVPGSYSGFIFGSASKYEPMQLRAEAVPEANPKNHMMITVTDGLLEFNLNEKKVFRANDAKLPRSGPFVIEIKGAATLENPRCVGQ